MSEEEMVDVAWVSLIRMLTLSRKCLLCFVSQHHHWLISTLKNYSSFSALSICLPWLGDKLILAPGQECRENQLDRVECGKPLWTLHLALVTLICVWWLHLCRDLVFPRWWVEQGHYAICLYKWRSVWNACLPSPDHVISSLTMLSLPWPQSSWCIH